ncbi:NusG domain II-containing protein [Erysipelothrix sp. HDW6A]|uniref:NusG domain II-containing protein n=1 Tax=Erysipelothrix sp. HDW6A TaxID=2714928 RepID=UPI00140D945D|nr:NusG domain II-containing protein [Erysipelothrix sp. HDW6A]QIK57751.1 NusG domain II-containing protein [Erysipelothrix sp. HDW6A]
MNRSDKVFIAVVLLLSVGLFFSTGKLISAVDSDSSHAVVMYKDEEILRLNMNKDGHYTVPGDLGDVVIEIKDGRIRVADEISPLNYCSIQGWVDKTNVPIVCLPNKILIVVEADNTATEEDIIIR